MLALEKSKTHRGRCTPNILPCRINHNGPVTTSKRYWSPSVQPDGKVVAYFRGRKLHGKALKVPSAYRGVVVEKTDRILPVPEPRAGPALEHAGEVDVDGEAEGDVEVRIMEEQATFEEIVVWGHEVLPDGMADPYVRAVEDWIQFAEGIHSFDVGVDVDGKKT